MALQGPFQLFNGPLVTFRSVCFVRYSTPLYHALGDAIDFGDTTARDEAFEGVSNCHGGL